jgi:hypothetical protein
MKTDLLSEIDKFLASEGIGEHRFGILAASNGRLVERLRSGGRIWPETEQQVRDFMASRRKATHEQERA